MDIIIKLKNIILNLYSKKIFRISFAILFLAFVLKNYSSAPKNIKKIKEDKKISSIFSLNKMGQEVQKKAFIKQEQLKEIKQSKLIKEKEINKISKTTLEHQLSKNKQNIFVMKSTSQNGDLVIAEMILFDGDLKNIMSKTNEMPVIINNDKQNIFAKYLKNKKVGDSVIIPISNFITNQQLPTNKIFYKLTIKSIRSFPKK
jgi:hypothetical protein